MRMLWDPAKYCDIGGDAYLSGTIKGFEVIPYPFLATVTGLPEAVGDGYKGDCLFTLNEDGTYTANYRESMLIIEDLFPKDKKIFLMCGGGGYAMIAVFENEFVSNKKWIEHEEFTDLIAIAESTPGPIAINSATYIGYKVAGFWGSFFATLGMVLPSLMIIFCISLVFEKFLYLYI